MDSKIVKADRKAVTAAVVDAASKVAAAYMKKYYATIDVQVKCVAESEYAAERREAARFLRDADGAEILDDLFSHGQDHMAHDDEVLVSSINAVLNKTVEPPAPSKSTESLKDLEAAVLKVRWEDLTDKGRKLLVDDLSKSYAENAAERYVEKFEELADEQPGDTLSEINEAAMDSLAEDQAIEGSDICEDHAFVLKHLVPKRKASDSASDSTAKRACP